MPFISEKLCGLQCKLDIHFDLKVCKKKNNKLSSYHMMCAFMFSWLVV